MEGAINNDDKRSLALYLTCLPAAKCWLDFGRYNSYHFKVNNKRMTFKASSLRYCFFYLGLINIKYCLLSTFKNCR